MIKLRFLVLLVAMILLTAACGGADQDNGSSSQPPDSNEEISTVDTTTDSGTSQADISPESLPAYDLTTGDYTLTITGAVEGGTAYTGTRRDPVEYGPYGTANNSEGNMDITMRWDGTYNGTAYDVAVVLILRDGIAPGTHPIGDSLSGDSTFNVRGLVDVDEMGVQDFDSNVSGAITLDSANRQYANGTFEFSAENRDGEQVTVSGSFHLIPFSRNVDSELTLSGAVDENFADITTIGWDILQEEGFYDIHFNTVNSGLILKLPADVGAGTYEVNADSALRADWAYNFPASGTVELTEVGEFYSGSLNLTATTDDGEVTITGTFEAIPSAGN